MEKPETKPKELKADVAGKYKVLDGHGVGEYHFKGRVIHLDQLSLEDADKCVAEGLPYLVAQPPAKTAKQLPQA